LLQTWCAYNKWPKLWKRCREKYRYSFWIFKETSKL